MLRRSAIQSFVKSTSTVINPTLSSTTKISSKTFSPIFTCHHHHINSNNNNHHIYQQHESSLFQLQHQFRSLSINHHPHQQQQQTQQSQVQFQDAEFIEGQFSEILEDETSQYNNNQQQSRRRITASQLPKHNAKEMASYPSVTFEQRDLRQGMRKVNDVARMIRGLNAKEALYHLEFCGRKIGVPLAKFLKGCMTTCENFHGLNADRLLVKKAFVGRGKIMKRIRYHAKMRHGVMTRKRTHFYITLVEVPYKENERRLGRYGWTNATWEKIYAMNEKQREAREAREAQEESAAEQQEQQQEAQQQ